MEPMSISEFARRSCLSPKALHLYDEMGLQPPDRIDVATGYRCYAPEHIDPARPRAALRQLGIPLAQIKVVLDLEPGTAADRIAEYWAAVETEHAARRDLAGSVVKRLHGRRSVMHEVGTRENPSCSLLCLKRNIDGWAGAWRFGKEFVELLKERPLPPMEGRAGAVFCIYWGEVSDDSDGPVELCRPVPDEEAEVLAALVPRTILAHRASTQRGVRQRWPIRPDECCAAAAPLGVSK
jgi:DNA-binding transcriptional MerR regulator